MSGLSLLLFLTTRSMHVMMMMMMMMMMMRLQIVPTMEKKTNEFCNQEFDRVVVDNDEALCGILACCV